MAKKMGNKFVALCTIAVGAVYAAGYIITETPTKTLAATTSSQSAGPATALGTQTSSQNGASGTGSFQGQSGGFSHRHDDGRFGERHHHDDGDYGEGGDNGDGEGSDGDHGGYGGYGSSSGAYGSSGSGAGSGFSGSSGSGSSGSGSSGSSSSASTPSQSSSTQTKTKTAPASQKYIDGTYNGSGSNRIGMVSVAVTIQSGKIQNVQITQCYTHYPESYINPALPNEVMSTQNPNVNNISGATMSTEDFQTAVLQALSEAQNPSYKG